MPPAFLAIAPVVSAIAGAASAGTGIAQGIDSMSKGGGSGVQANTAGFSPNDSIRTPEQIKAMQEGAKNARDPMGDLQTYINEASLNRVPGATPNSVHEAKRVLEHMKRIETAKIRGDAGMLKDATEDYMESMGKLQENDPAFFKGFSENQKNWDVKQGGGGAPTTTELLFQEAGEKQKQADADADFARNRAFVPTDLKDYKEAYGKTEAQMNSDIAQAQRDRANDPSVQHLLQLAKGEGPAAEAAKAQLRAGLSQSNQMAMSQAASARGGAGNRALAGRAALMSGAANSQSAANQAAGMRADMAMTGIKGLAQQRAENMTQDNELYGMRTNTGLKNSLFLGDTAQKDMSGRIQQNTANDAAHASARDMGHRYYQDKMGIPYKNAQTAQSGEAIRTGAAGAGAKADLERDKYGSGLILGGGLGAAQAADYWSKQNGDKKPGEATNDAATTPAADPNAATKQKNWDY